ncbi:MAG: hypothetical protein WC869_00685 [Phycisphaerae bacterium]|jgi:hypothetical protein
MSDASQTIQGSYTLVTMPDGSEVAMHRLKDGRWVTTAERLAAEEAEAARLAFEARFNNTNTKPNEHQDPTTEVLRPKLDLASRLAQAHASANRLDAYLGEILGPPTALLARDPLCMERVAKVKARPQEMRHVLGLIHILGTASEAGQKWEQVRKELFS